MNDKEFLNKYEELLNKGYCNCNEMNCIDNNSPRRILNIVKVLQTKLQQKENIINEFMEELKWQRKVSLSLNKAFTVGRIDTLIDKLQELKGDNK